jgi:hypothetical protein
VAASYALVGGAADALALDDDWVPEWLPEAVGSRLRDWAGAVSALGWLPSCVSSGALRCCSCRRRRALPSTASCGPARRRWARRGC